MKTFSRAALFAMVASLPQFSAAAISVTSDAFTYSQSFDTLITSGSAQPWANDSTLAGWSLFNSAQAAITAYSAGSGGSNAGTFNSFGTGTDSDRALGSTASGGAYFGSPATGAIAGYMAVAFTNDASDAIASVGVSYDGEQWRNGGNTNAQSLVAEYGIGATFATVAVWTAAGSGFDFVSPVTGATAAAVDGNVAGLVTGLGGTLGNLNLAVGQTLWIRWADRNDSGNDHGMGIDNFSLSNVTLVPEPTTALLGGLGLMALLRRRR